ncbi:MAG: hypothetical protein PUC39_08720 [Lachnospiraceae bacterium]|nr:hypothetical protein [Lachnospiraceae bacterium]
MADNTFDKGVEYLKEAYDKLTRIEQLNESLNTAKSDAKRLEKMSAQEERDKKEEIASTIKKRKAEINAAYDKEMDVIQSKIKKIDSKRENHKSRQQDARYRAETEELRQEVDNCTTEIRNILKQYHISRMCRSNLYYSLFLPKGIKDYLILLLWILITLLAIPLAICGIGKYTFLKTVESQMVYYVLIFVCCISLVFITYLVITNRTKVRYRAQLLHCRNEKDKIRAIRRQMRAVHNKIKKDRDESDYNLGSFDEQIAAFRREMEAIGEQKKQALMDFDTEKKPLVEREIASAHDAKISEYDAQRKEAEDFQDQAASELAALRLDISNQYEAYLGKEYVTLEKLDILIGIMEEEGVTTVGDAIAVYKGKLDI